MCAAGGMFPSASTADEEVSALRYRVRKQAPRDALEKIAKSARSYYELPRVARGTGRKLECRFPESTAMLPDVSGKQCCIDNAGKGGCTVGFNRMFDAPTWSALNFYLAEPTEYGYAFESSGRGTGAVFTAIAYGDLDCDGILSTFSISGKGISEGFECSVEVGAVKTVQESE